MINISRSFAVAASMTLLELFITYENYVNNERNIEFEKNVSYFQKL